MDDNTTNTADIQGKRNQVTRICVTTPVREIASEWHSVSALAPETTG